MKKIIWTFLFVFLVLGPIKAQDDQLAPVTGTIAVTNVNIVPSPGELIENGTVLVKDGLITAVGNNVTVPPGARIIEADSMYLYSGFILGMSNIGIKMPEQKDRPDIKDPGNPPNDQAGITPDRAVNEYLDPGHRSISDWRAAGFTLAQTAPSGGMLPGTAAVILLKGKSIEDMILKPGTALYATFDGARRMYPSNILGVMAKHRDLFRQAEQSRSSRQTYMDDPSGRTRPNYSKVREAYLPVLEKQIPFIFNTEEVLSAQRAMLLQEDLGFDLVLAELKQGWDISSDISETNTKVLFSLDLPELKDKDKEKDTVKDETPTAEKQLLESRREEFTKKHYQQMGQYASANVPFGFSGVEGKPADVQKAVQKMVEHGLSQEAALTALTTTPASMLGISNISGTVESGKMANLVISSKPYFEKDAKVRYVMVEGMVYENEEKEAKESDPETLEKVTGSWSYTADTPDGPITGDMVLEESGGVLSGTITNSLTGEETTLQDLVFADDNLSFSFDVIIQGQTMNVLAVLTVSEDELEGTFSGAGEAYSVKGTRSPNQ